MLPVWQCAYGLSQTTHQRGRVSAQVRYGPVTLRLDVPATDQLLAWAVDPQQRLAATVVFLAADGGQALETLRLAAAYCVSYTEIFRAGDTTSGAYELELTLVDPSGFTLAPGGPHAYAAPAADTHGAPPPLVAATTLAGPAVEQVRRLPRITGRPPFTVKEASRGKPGLDRLEFERQLRGQEAGLNRLTVAEFLANRDRYLTQAVLTGDGRDPKGDAAQKALREEALRAKIVEIRRQNHNLTRQQAKDQAKQWLATQASLHDPDQVAGGHADQVTGLGDSRVNSSIGAQWPKRIKAIDQQIRAHAEKMTAAEQAATYLLIDLPLV